MHKLAAATSILAMLLALEPLGCIGNSTESCAAGSTCGCNGIGNCTRTCEGAGCQFECSGTGNCTFACDAGGCSAHVSGTGNVEMSCKGGGCSLTCDMRAGSCELQDCTKDCTIVCRGIASCSQTCSDPSCAKR
jgi:hypothetical protein